MAIRRAHALDAVAKGVEHCEGMPRDRVDEAQPDRIAPPTAGSVSGSGVPVASTHSASRPPCGCVQTRMASPWIPSDRCRWRRTPEGQAASWGRPARPRRPRRLPWVPRPFREAGPWPRAEPAVAEAQAARRAGRQVAARAAVRQEDRAHTLRARRSPALQRARAPPARRPIRCLRPAAWTVRPSPWVHSSGRLWSWRALLPSRSP
eukprot:6396018-Prymnesium_polylepis.1